MRRNGRRNGIAKRMQPIGSRLQVGHKMMTMPVARWAMSSSSSNTIEILDSPVRPPQDHSTSGVTGEDSLIRATRPVPAGTTITIHGTVNRNSFGHGFHRVINSSSSSSSTTSTISISSISNSIGSSISRYRTCNHHPKAWYCRIRLLTRAHQGNRHRDRTNARQDVSYICFKIRIESYAAQCAFHQLSLEKKDATCALVFPPSKGSKYSALPAGGCPATSPLSSSAIVSVLRVFCFNYYYAFTLRRMLLRF